MRLLFIITGLGTGGAERMLVKLLATLAGRQCECAVVSLLDAGSQGAPIRALGIPVSELRINRPAGLVAAPFRLAAIARRFRPDAIQGWMYHGNLAALWAWLASGRAARLVWGVRQTFHGMAREKPATRLVIRLNALCSRLPAAIIFNSRASAGQHAAIGFVSGQAAVIPNGFDPRGFHPDAEARAQRRAELGIVADAPVVGLMARYHPMKDHEGFLQAAALIARELPEARFVLAGSGVDTANAAIGARIDALGLSSRVRLLGEVAAPETLYPAFDVLALSSAWGEAFPNVLGEAMACGVPCVATAVGDAEWIVGDTGAIVAPAQPAALAQRTVELLRLSAVERSALGERARARVLKLFALGAVAEDYRQCYATGAIRAECRYQAPPGGAESRR